jgi:CRP-like cAMP-binding protein
VPVSAGPSIVVTSRKHYPHRYIYARLWDLSDTDIKTIAEAMPAWKLKRGDFLCRKGDSSNFLWVLAEGQVDVYDEGESEATEKKGTGTGNAQAGNKSKQTRAKLKGLTGNPLTQINAGAVVGEGMPTGRLRRHGTS